MEDVLEIIRGEFRLRLCSNGLRWWIECDHQGTGETYRHEHRAGSRAGVMTLWDEQLGSLARGQFDPENENRGWWCISFRPDLGE